MKLHLRVVAESGSDSRHVSLSSSSDDKMVDLGSKVRQSPRVDERTKLEGGKQASSTVLFEDRHVIEDIAQCVKGCRKSPERQLGGKIAILGSDEERVGARRKLRGIMRDSKRSGLRNNARHDW